jgi:murein DD-endopeptidase MepM/ murein hydrolase activator NlpD
MSNWPTDFREVNQGFGENPDSYGQFGLPGHEGVDIEAPLGSNVYAVADGEVYRVLTDPSGHTYGIAVYIRHANGYRTVYAQLQEALVEVGDTVVAGELIALSNNTGNSFGSHLHFGLYLDGATEAGRTNFPLDIMDPTPFLWHLAPLQFVNNKETTGE